MNDQEMLAAYNRSVGADGTAPLFSQKLLDLAEAWPTYSAWVTVDNQTHTCLRCRECDGVIYVATGVVGHLIHEHGYRRDGRQWTNENEEITDGDDAEGVVSLK